MHYRYGRMICKNDMHKDMQDSNAMIDMRYRNAIKKCKTDAKQICNKDIQYRNAIKICNDRYAVQICTTDMEE